MATMIFHFFAFGSYASGLLGAALADSKAGPHLSFINKMFCANHLTLCLEKLCHNWTISGKYRTILYIGILYAVGQAILAVGALSIGEKTHMEPVRITMLIAILRFIKMIQHFGVDTIQTFRSRSWASS